ncbi:MAG: glycosyltransferase family 2 protein [Candidatus Diapherotrites archaeon]|nr:glycosyltransferase family 2 protein [Candidatus Diapherotrites archaeon]
MKGKICIVIPTHNNESEIAGVLEKALNFSECVIVVDSSNDGTQKKIKKFRKALLLREKPGKGRQARRGIKEALGKKCGFIALMDGDGEREPADLDGMLAALEKKKADICIGNREKMRSGRRKALNLFSTAWINFATGFGLKDAQSGFVLGKREAFKKMKLESENFEIETEIVLEAFRLKLGVCQAPVSSPKFSPSKCSKARMAEINAFFDSWVLEHLDEFGFSALKKAVLWLACNAGLAFSWIFQKCLI